MKTVIVSIDALFSSDLPSMEKMEGFAPLFRNCVVAKDMMEIYPALTYPCHASIVSGCYPAVHKINQNTVLAPQRREEDWLWYHNQLGCKTLFDYYYEYSASTAAVFWPVTANAPVQYLIPEIWSIRADSSDMVKNASSAALEDIINTHISCLDFDEKRMQDTFAVRCSLNMITQFNPDVFFIHFCVLDQMRHRHGIYSEQTTEALLQCSEWYAEIMSAYQLMNPDEEILSVVLGDHGQLNCRRAVSLNYLFCQKGFLVPGNRLDYKAYCHSAGISAHIYVRKPEICAQLEEIFQRLVQEKILLTFYKRDQVKPFGLDGTFTYVLEAAEGYCFDNDWSQWISEKEGGAVFGAHGHFPGRGDMPPFIVSGAGINGRHTVQGCGLVDIAPTLCEISNIKYAGMDGRPIRKITQFFNQT